MMTEPGYNLVLPATKRGFSPGFDAAWFFSKNYGVGIKYGFYTSDYKKESSLDLIDEMSYTYESTILAFNEKTHLFGPAVYTRWPLGNSKWMILANAGVVVLHNNLLGINRKIITIKAGRNGIIPGGLDLIDDTIYEQYYETVSDQKGVTVGFTLSAAIRYEIAPFAGISVQTNGLYASLSEMRYYNIINEQYENRDLSRKISRIGLSAAIDFCF
ncbi:MAG: hypothetical protein LBB62_04295 [Proteiniphilum sp.]|nr:hypothetical protein [Proteiniphilum sp.]